MRQKAILTTLLIIFSLSVYSQIKEANEKEIRKNLSFLASDKLKGRASGTREDKIAAKYIASKLSEYGFRPLIGNYPLVPFEFTRYRKVEKRSVLSVGSITLIEGKDYSVLPISASAEIKGKLVFERSSKDETEKMIEGKIVVIESDSDSIPFKVTAFRDRGAVGMLFFSGETLNRERRTTNSGLSMPVAQISREAANKISALEGEEVEYKSVIKVVKGKSYNVVMHIGAENTTESILLGAHYDHLGMGGKGSGSMSPKTKEIHNGADDNASGVASVLEMGRLLAKKKGNLKQNIIVVAFGGEERGLLGSKIIADTLKKLNLSPVLMLNLDMVGRLVNNRLQIGGGGTFSQADSIIKYSNSAFNFDLTITRDGYGPSDHSSFYSTGVPVLYFTTGVHKEYHTPLDDVELINFPGMVSEINFITTIAYSIAQSGEYPKFIKITAPATPARSGFKVTLGLIPDFTYEAGDGFKVGPITDGKPAQMGGMLAGDIITAINSKKVSNIYDYMARLGELKAGERIQVNVKRDGEEIKLIIQL